MSKIILPGKEVDFGAKSMEEMDTHSFLKGSNNKRVVVIVTSFEEEINGAETSGLFEKIIQSIGLTMDDISLIDISKSPVSSFKVLQRKFNPTSVILFGINPQKLRLNVSVKGYQVIHLNEVQLLFSHRLGQLQEDVERKKLLWTALQSMFKNKKEG